MNAFKTKVLFSLALLAGLGALFANPTSSQAADKPAVTVASNIAPLMVKNYTRTTLRIYVDGNFQMAVPPLSYRTVFVSQSYHVFRAISTDGRTVARVGRMGSNGFVWSIGN